jgi:hypothetical protein
VESANSCIAAYALKHKDYSKSYSFKADIGLRHFDSGVSWFESVFSRLNMPLSDYTIGALKKIQDRNNAERNRKRTPEYKKERRENKSLKKQRNSLQPEDPNHFYKQEEDLDTVKPKGCGCGKASSEGKYCGNKCSCKSNGTSCSTQCKGCRGRLCLNPNTPVNAAAANESAPVPAESTPKAPSCSCGKGCFARCGCRNKEHRCSIWCKCSCKNLHPPGNFSSPWALFIVDTETTGKNNTDEIIEFCAFEPISNEVFHILIMPTIPISNGAMDVHGITLENLK